MKCLEQCLTCSKCYVSISSLLLLLVLQLLFIFRIFLAVLAYIFILTLESVDRSSQDRLVFGLITTAAPSLHLSGLTHQKFVTHTACSVWMCVFGGGALGGRRERGYAHFCRHRPWLTVFHYYSRMLAVAIAEGKRVVLVETLKARRDIHHFLLYFIS